MKAVKKKWIFPAVAVLLILIAFAVFAVSRHLNTTPFSGLPGPRDDGRMEADLMRMEAEGYDSVFLSMHDSNNFNEAYFESYRGLDTLVASHTLLDIKELASYLEKALSSGNTVTNFYFVLDPELLWMCSGRKDERWSAAMEAGLYAYIKEHPEITFEVLLPYPYRDYWLNLEEQDFNTLMAVYHKLVSELSAWSNVKVYFPGAEEWVMVNPGNYEDSLFDANDVVTQKLFLHTFCDGAYQIHGGNVQEYWDALAEIRAMEMTSPRENPDLSEWCFVFFGDSVLGNFPGSISIPGYLAGLSGATVYNYAVGGASASAISEETQDFPNVMRNFMISEVENSPEGCIFAPGGVRVENKKICFVINFGFNDYFSGFPVNNPEDPLDTTTFTGGMRSSILQLKEAFPDAAYLIVTPTVTSYYGEGVGVNSPEGGALKDYVEAAEGIAREFDAYFLNNYHDFVVTQDNLFTYLSDGCHPNEKGRLLLADTLMDFAEEHLIP